MISAKIVADSLGPNKDRLTTMLITFPRYILAELNTHRMLSKNSASSRAIPFEKMVKSVQENPFIPIAWQKDHKGMQGNEYLDKQYSFECTQRWLIARDNALKEADYLSGYGATKQLCNRLLEPFMWHTVLISGTEFSNFFELRCPDYQFNDGTGKIHHFKSKKDAIKTLPDLFQSGIHAKLLSDLDWLLCNKGQADIHMMALAEEMWDAYNESIPAVLNPGDWHIPFSDKIQPESNFGDFDDIMTRVKISTAMSARTSYTVIGEEKEFGTDKQLELHDRMAKQVPFHASPFEHCARVMNEDEYNSYSKGIMNINSIKYLEDAKDMSIFINNENLGWCRNYRGFIQYRELLENKQKIN